MSNLLIKSNESSSSATLLINESKYNSSIHCSYYSCIQMMSYIIESEMGINTSQFISLAKTESKTSHAWLINSLKKLLHNKNNEAKRKFSQQIHRLKEQRINADYHHKLFIKEESNKCLEIASETNSILKLYFTK